MTSAVKRNLLLIHGRDFKPQQETWLELSLAALRKGIERDYPDNVDLFDALDVHDAWYGDLSNELLRGLGKEYDEQLDVGDRRNVLKTLGEIAARKKFSIRQYDCLPGKSALPEFVVAVAAPVLGAVGMTLPLVGRSSRISRPTCATNQIMGVKSVLVFATSCAKCCKAMPSSC